MRVAIIGYGKMGKEVEQQLLGRGHCIDIIIDRDNIDDLAPEKLSGVDVAIEFSVPDAAYDNITKCLNCGVPIVCGTTAWLDRYDEVLQLSRSKNVSFFYASNFSIGVNVFFKVNKYLAELMNRFNQYDVTLNEVHHTQKLDAPSGTAVTLANDIIDKLERKNKWHLGVTTVYDELEVTAQRRSTVAGQHTIVWESPQDLITIEHEAKSRAGFALGAVLAAEYVAGAKPGVYTMDDLLDF